MIVVVHSNNDSQEPTYLWQLLTIEFYLGYSGIRYSAVRRNDILWVIVHSGPSP